MSDGLLINQADLEIDFSTHDQDVFERAESRLLNQFQNSCVLRQFLKTLTDQVQELRDAGMDCLKKRTLNDAAGVQLDAIGRIVGQDRTILNAAERPWFGPDAESPNLLNPDSGTSWVPGADLTGDLQADDGQYLSLILSKIFKNHISSASLPEVQIFIQLLTNWPVSFLRVAPLDANLLVYTETPPYIIETIQSIITNARDADEKYLIPLAATTRIVGIVFVPSTNKQFSAFTPDREGGRVDFAKASIYTIL